MKKLIFSFAFNLFSYVLIAQVSLTVESLSPGGLKDAIDKLGFDLTAITDLTVTGKIDERDFYIMSTSNMTSLKNLNLELIKIYPYQYYPGDEIPKWAFNSSRLKSIILPKSVKSIGDFAFQSSSISGNLVIPDSVTYIGESAFYWCYNLTGDLLIPNSVKFIGKNAFNYCKGFNGTLTLPNSLKKINQYTFSNCSGFKGNLIIPDSVEIIEDYSFSSCNGFSGNLKLPKSLRYIYGHAFSFCSGFSGSLILPDSIESIGEWAFQECSGFTGNLIIPNSLHNIALGTFQFCSGMKGTLTLPNTMFWIGENAFSGCGFSGNLNIPNSVTKIEGWAFANCVGLNGNLNISNSLESIGVLAFSNCPNFIGSLIIPNSVRTIESMAFNDCDKFNTIFIPSSCTSIAPNSFSGGYALNRITVALKSPFAINSFTFYDVDKNTCELVVPIGSKTLYQNADYWKDFKNIIEQIFVSYDAIGGTAIPDTIVLYNSIISSPKEPYKLGYLFKGWFMDENYTIEFDFNSEKITTNTTLYAKWERVKFLVKFIPNGGNSINDTLVEFYSFVKEPSIPFKKNFLFNGWYSDSLLINKWEFYYVVSRNLSLYAGWSDRYYYVIYDNGNGWVTGQNMYLFNSYIKVPDLTGYIINGYIQEGYYKDAQYNNKWEYNKDRIYSDTILYVKFVKIDSTISHKIKFKTYSEVIIQDTIAYYNTRITQPKFLNTTGNTFLGWYKDLDFYNEWVFNYDLVNSDKTLYAKWDINSYFVSFNSNGGDQLADTLVNFNAAIAPPRNIIKTGYTFVGWYKDSEFTNIWNFTNDLVRANTTLYAKWDLNNYTVSFYSNGGDQIEDTIVKYNTVISQPKNISKTGYTFIGWYKDSEFTNIWNFTNDLVRANTTLYAKWDLNNYTVSFYSNGGDQIDDTIVKYNTVISQPKNISKTGYTFIGWYKDSEFTSNWNFTNDLVKSNTTLYALWELNSYTVSFNSNGGDQLADTIVNFNTAIVTPKDISKTGYTFLGWYKDSEFINVWNFSTDRIFMNITLFAKWDKILNTNQTKTEDIYIYPNLVKDFINIKGNKIQYVTIYSLSGIILLNQVYNSSIEKIDISSFNPGCYIISVKDIKGYLKFGKFIKK